MTEAEFFAGVSMDTLLMGLMGGAYLGLTGRAKAKLNADIPYHSKAIEVPETAVDIPSAETKTYRVEEIDPVEVKIEAREQGIRDPEEVARLSETTPSGS